MRTHRSAVSRRSFVKALGAAAAVLPIANLLRVSISEAAPMVAPLRLITVWYQYQTNETYYCPQDGKGAMAPPGSNFTLNFPNSVLLPLAPYQSKLVVFRGLDYQDEVVQGGGHRSQGTCFSGGKYDYSVNSAIRPTTQASSIDQYLFARMGPKNTLQPIVTGVNQAGQFTTSYSNGVAVPWVPNPIDVFNTYFGNYQSGTSSAAARALTRRNSVLGFAQGGLKELMGRLSGPEQQKLDLHMTSLMGLQSQLNAPISTAASCQPPPSSSILDEVDPGRPPWTNIATDNDNYATMITEAFACDITRFASLQLSTGYYDQMGADAHIIPGLESFSYNGGIHGGISHGGIGVTPNDPIVLQYQALFGVYWINEIAKLMNKLAAVSDPYNPSQTLLDNTVILVCAEGRILGTNTGDLHGAADIQILLTGGCGGMFKMGQVVEATPRLATPVQVLQSDYSSYYAGMPHNALLATIVNAFEKNQQMFNPAYVPNILTQYGDYGTAAEQASLAAQIT
jgi:hypothetical protein